jgi:hypothetical protein
MRTLLSKPGITKPRPPFYSPEKAPAANLLRFVSSARVGIKTYGTVNHTNLRPLNEQTHVVNLVIGHKLDCGIRKDPDQSGRMALEESPTTAFLINLCTSTKRSAPSPGILLKVRIGGLKEDLDSV